MTPLLLMLATSAPTHGHPRPLPPPPPVVVVQAPPVIAVPPRPLTVEEFAHGFKPTPGHHTVCLIHPKTCRPVEVCFSLPDCGCPKVHHNKHHVEFDYGRREVDIRFRHDGTVDVKAR